MSSADTPPPGAPDFPAIFAALEAFPVVELIGIVRPNSGGGLGLGRDDLWALYMHFDAWRVRGGPLCRDRLSLERQCTTRELHRIRDSFEPDTVIAVRARLETGALALPPRALLVEVVGACGDDAELNAVLADLKKPVTHVDAQLGTLTFDRGLALYTGRILWRSALIEISFCAPDEEALAPLVSRAHELLRDQAKLHAGALDRIEQDLLTLKNESWLDDGEAELTAEAFRARPKLTNISVEPDGDACFWFDDGDLFWGHTIGVSVTAAGDVEAAEIHG